MITGILREDCATLAQELADRLRPLNGRTVLITGASGFLGSYFLDLLASYNARLAESPIRLVAADNFKIGLPSRIEHLVGRTDVAFLRQDVSKPFPEDLRPDYIIHLAGIASPSFYRTWPLETIAVNVDGTRNVLELARRNCRSMLSFSSSEIYGDPDPAHIPTGEAYRGNVSSTGPRACYDESKRLNETLCTAYNTLYSLPVKVIRPFNVYGPGQRIDDGRIIPDLMRAAMAGGPLVLFSDGRATRSFCYAADFVHASMLLLMSDADGEVFNVGNDFEISIAQVAGIVAELAATPALPVEHRLSADLNYLVDNPNRRCPDLGKLRHRMGWAPRFGLAAGLVEGLARTLAHYREEAASGRISAA